MPRITYFLRPDHNKMKTFSLYCRVSYRSTKTEFSLKEKISPESWDQASQKCNGRGPQKKYVSALMDSVSYSLKTAAIVGDYSTAKELVQCVIKEEKKPVSYVEDLIEEYIQLQVNRRSSGTIQTYRVKQRNFIDYQRFKKTRFTFLSFGMVEAERFKAWFMSRAGTKKVDTANRNILFFKAAMSCALKQGAIKEFELVNYKGEKDPVSSPVYLDPEELETMSGREFKSPMLNRIRDLFLFQCFTGLSYSDIYSDWELKVIDGHKILTGSRIKTKQLFFVPVPDGSPALEIFNKYSGQLPKYTNEVYNRILKEIAALCEIEKRITTHTARKTFATLKDSEGWTRETIAKMLGHKSIKTTEIYYLGDSSLRLLDELRKRVP